ncbi:MAG: hypothetical protein HY549_03290 [Elusimicrobia bacterium]|nr:hypothetical protein [Elusimicrobiota bacterium]
MRSRMALALLLLGANAAAQNLFFDGFEGPDRLVTNEYARRFPNDPAAAKSPNWFLTSGSLFISGGEGWTGIPDHRNVDSRSSTGNNSSVFRMVSQRSDFADVEVSLKVMNRGLSSSSGVPPTSWDGTHIWVRYQSPLHIYYASINRRDNTVIIKKKVPGGPSNGGSYYNLSPSVPHQVPYNTWQLVRVTAQNNPDGSVTISLYSGGKLLVSATDKGIGGPPIRNLGRVGIRGDNAELKFDDFMVQGVAPGGVALNPSPVPPPSQGQNPSPEPQPDPSPSPNPSPEPSPAPGEPVPVPGPHQSAAEAKAREKHLSPALADGINDVAAFGPAAEEVDIFDLRGRSVFRGRKQGSALIVWDCKDGGGRVVESGVYLAMIRKTDSGVEYQSFAVVK